MMDKVDMSFQVVNELGNDTGKVINICEYVIKMTFWKSSQQINLA